MMVCVTVLVLVLVLTLVLTLVVVVVVVVVGSVVVVVVVVVGSVVVGSAVVVVVVVGVTDRDVVVSGVRLVGVFVEVPPVSSSARPHTISAMITAPSAPNATRAAGLRYQGTGSPGGGPGGPGGSP